MRLNIMLCALVVANTVACTAKHGSTKNGTTLVVLTGELSSLASYSTNLLLQAKTEPRLAPELVAVARFGWTYVGTTRSGAAVLEIPNEEFRALPADGAKELATNARIDRIKELVVLTHEKQSGDPASMGTLRVAGRMAHGRGFTVVAKDVIRGADLKALLLNKSVRYIEPNYVYRLESAIPPPNDPDRSKLWGMDNIGADSAWEVSIGDDSPIVAVIDSGVDLNHVDLRGNLWTNPGDDTVDGKDNDNNGFVDDTHGWDFSGTTGGQPIDQHGHGTHVAGTIGAIGNNNEGVVGVLWKAQIISLRIFNPDKLAYVDRVTAAIDYAIDNNARVLNLSWGGPKKSKAITEAIMRAGAKGALVVVAAGNASEPGNPGTDNDRFPWFPASLSGGHILKVVAISPSNELAIFSNYGAKTTGIAAPGEGIFSTRLSGSYGSASGTSMAAPHVSGAAALLWSTPTYGALTAPQMRNLLINNVHPEPVLKNQCISGGRLNLRFTANTGAAQPGERNSLDD